MLIEFEGSPIEEYLDEVLLFYIYTFNYCRATSLLVPLYIKAGFFVSCLSTPSLQTLPPLLCKDSLYRNSCWILETNCYCYSFIMQGLRHKYLPALWNRNKRQHGSRGTCWCTPIIQKRYRLGIFMASINGEGK